MPRASLTAAEKLELCEDREKRKFTWAAIEKKYGIKERGARNVVKNQQQQLRQQLKDGTLSTTAKSSKQSPFSSIESKLLQTIELARRSKLPVTKVFIRVQAMLLKDMLLLAAGEDIDEAERQRWLEFNFTTTSLLVLAVALVVSVMLESACMLLCSNGWQPHWHNVMSLSF